ncbi:MAG: PIG-L family deacetylase [Sphingomonadales bacterium]|nr:MAG: PIG-L family deacetylase [Sphingomonadales bacterium]
MIGKPKRMTVIAPHPDDETLGAGGTIARFVAEGVEVSVLIVSGHLPPLYPQEAFETTRREAIAAMAVLGVERFEFMEVPATLVHQRPLAEINGAINRFIRATNPEWVLIPFPDRHIDHRTIFDASVVACRPVHGAAPSVVLCYETLSETHWNVGGIEPAFIPDFFVDTSAYMGKKQDALNAYASQVHTAPSRSVEACMALAKFRGSQNGCDHAEAFKVVRIVV